MVISFEIRHHEGRNEATKFLVESKVNYSLMMFLTMNIGYAQKHTITLIEQCQIRTPFGLMNRDLQV